MEKEFIKSGFKKEAKYPMYFTKNKKYFIEAVGTNNDNVWRIWVNYGMGNIYIYLGYIRNSKEWKLIQDLLQI